MSVHKLTAGSGYDYLTRQVAAQDVTERGHSGLASYYSAQGEAPGLWIGSGLADLDGLNAGDPVTEEQMRSLFGSGRHPLAAQIRAAAADDGLSILEQERAAWLGTPYKVYSDVSAFRLRVAQRVAACNAERPLPAGSPGLLEDRARIRTEVAVELFREEFGRDPSDAREIAATIAKHSRPRTNAVAGFDLTFSPVKSVSTLWALADPPVAAAIERAHQMAVRDALTYLEEHALFTREGTKGVRQVETTGLVAAAFTHRDSRAGDPDLHTHVAVANKVRAKGSGKWLAIDGRLIFKANVAASETYNMRLEHHLRQLLGVRFEARSNPDGRKRAVREIVGVDPALNQRWSSRRESIESRRRTLAKRFQATHGRPPSPIESIQLAQQATLETRDAKHGPRSLAEQRAAWATQAEDALGGPRPVRAMIATALSPQPVALRRVDGAWIAQTAAGIQATMQAHRSHWQRWHVEAEALRQVRSVDLPTGDIDRVVDLLVDEVLTRRCVPLASDRDTVEVPVMLRRSDGASVYTIAGSTHFTSAEILAAEARIVARAGQRDGMRVPATAVDLAMLSCTANGMPLNAGQATLVREMATSGARLQLAIAPAGAGKTTAMRALAHAWAEGGGTVIGLAPSAAAADVLGHNINADTDTMAKLAWHLDHPGAGDLPGWAQQIGPASLVVIDEAGMADTVSLDKVVEFVSGRGGCVRLIGDDQQLAAVGAGGVLRDIQATHGSLHLSELMRFDDPAEGAASLALREGLTEALGFYLDRDRIHVGDLSTMTDRVFTAWRTGRGTGQDTLMLAPTRELVAELNQRARQHRLNQDAHPDQPAVTLADGNLASVGDTVITRTNDRTLRIAAARDWVKNGDRWRITALGADGSVTVRHATNGRFIDLPARYVAASVELGYACTIHTAQGVTADTSHTLLTGAESRQLAYTAATRGRTANHLYLEVVGDGDEHNVIRPDHTHPPTATDVLEQILARDDSARSATTAQRDAYDPAALLADEVNRYLDSLCVATETRLGPRAVSRLDAAADQIVPDLTRAGAWPTLRAHLLLLSAHGLDPVDELRAAATMREIDTASDVASVLDWRLDDAGLRSAGTGPLPWLPGVPPDLDDDPEWGPYLAARAARVRDLSTQIKDHAADTTDLPDWARQGQGRPETDLLAEVAVWRAATGADPSDRRPTGPTQISKAAHHWQAGLNTRLAGSRTPALAEWRDVFDHVLVHPRTDPFTALLAERLSAISRAGLDAPAMVRRALSDGPLPDDHSAAALWWRIAGHLSPAVAAHVVSDHHLTTRWAHRLPDLLGTEQAAAIRASSWWPTLVTVVDHAIARGERVEDLFAHRPDTAEDLDPCQALVWRISVSNDPPPTQDERDSWPALYEPADDDTSPFWDDAPEWVPTEQEWQHLRPLDSDEPPHAPTNPDPPAGPPDEPTPELEEQDNAYLQWAAWTRQLATPLPPSDRQIEQQLAHAHQADHAAVSPQRIIELNRLALAYYTDRFAGSWAQPYLTERVRTDLTGDPHIQPGYAPAGWTNLVTHLRRHGATDLELTESGLATTTQHGRIIDRFRDRLIFPITRIAPSGDIEPLGFVARRHPDRRGHDAGPKYLNTPDTALFHKGAQLHIVREDLLHAEATPVLVEGPMDALAVTLAGAGRYVGVASLGTALTEQQATQLAQAVHGRHRGPVVATDADHAGQVAAQRSYWLLTQHGLTPHTIPLRPGSDPSDLLATQGGSSLHTLLNNQHRLCEDLLTERLTHLDGLTAARAAVRILATISPTAWQGGIDRTAQTTNLPAARVRRELAAAVRSWDEDPRAFADEEINDLPAVGARLAANITPTTSATSRTPSRRTPNPDLIQAASRPPQRR